MTAAPSNFRITKRSATVPVRVVARGSIDPGSDGCITAREIAANFTPIWRASNNQKPLPAEFAKFDAKIEDRKENVERQNCSLRPLRISLVSLPLKHFDSVGLIF